MWKAGIFLFSEIMVIEVIVVWLGLKMAKKCLIVDDHQIPRKRLFHLLKVLAIIYTIPIFALCMALVYSSKWVGVIIPLILLSVFPVSQYIIIPLVDKKKQKLYDEKNGIIEGKYRIIEEHLIKD